MSSLKTRLLKEKEELELRLHEATMALGCISPAEQSRRLAAQEAGQSLFVEYEEVLLVYAAQLRNRMALRALG